MLRMTARLPVLAFIGSASITSAVMFKSLVRGKLTFFIAVAVISTGAHEAPAQTAGQSGKWLEQQLSWQQQGVTCIHVVALHTGKVLCLGEGSPDPRLLFDPTTNGARQVFYAPDTHDVFCSGHAALPDGRIVFVGGDELDSRTNS